MADRTFFFGLISVNAWGMNWGYTAAQVELMATDKPIIVYTNGKPPKPSAKALNSVAEKWKEKYGNGEKVDINELLKGEIK